MSIPAHVLSPTPEPMFVPICTHDEGTHCLMCGCQLHCPNEIREGVCPRCLNWCDEADTSDMPRRAVGRV